MSSQSLWRRPCLPDAPARPIPCPPLSYAPLVHPFNGANLFHDTDSAAAGWARANGDPAWLRPILDTPQAVWLTGPQALDRLPTLAGAAASRRELLVLVAYYVPNRDCGGEAIGGAPGADAYLAWIDRAAGGPGTRGGDSRARPRSG